MTNMLREKITFPMSILGGHFPIKSISGKINLLRMYFGLLILDFESARSVTV